MAFTYQQILYGLSNV